MINFKANKQTGFTLLELIVVIGLLGLVTSLASDFMINESNQQRFDTSKNRLEQVRYAIIGDSSRSLNGQPTISGFIADTGRLPGSTANLLGNIDFCTKPEFTNKASCVLPAEWKAGVCSDVSYINKADCESNSATWSVADANWNGPYLRANNDNDFYDGWSNSITTTVASGGLLTITSLGLDRAVGESTSEYAQYEADQSVVIYKKDYSISGQSFEVIFNTIPSGCDKFEISPKPTSALDYAISASSGVSTIGPIVDIPYRKFTITTKGPSCTSTTNTIFIHPINKDPQQNVKFR